MARKKKQQDLKSLHEETQKALDKLKENLETEQSNEIIASREIVLSLVKHKDKKVELGLRNYKNYSEVFMSLLLKGVYTVLIIDNLPENLKKEYANWLMEAYNTVVTAINAKLSKDVLKNVEEAIEKSV